MCEERGINGRIKLPLGLHGPIERLNELSRRVMRI